MDEPQPSATPPDGAVATAEPQGGAQQTAAQPTEPQQQSQQPSNTDENFDYDAWLQQKGVDPSTPEGRAAIAKSWRGIEQKMHATTMQASELRKSLTPSQPAQPANGSQDDPMMSEFIQDYRRDKLISGFKESHADWKEHEPAMVKVLNEVSPSGYTNSQLVNAGLLSLETVYALARASAPDNSKQVRAEAQNEVLQTLANTQRAGGGNAQASSANPQSHTEDPINAAIRAARGGK